MGLIGLRARNNCKQGTCRLGIAAGPSLRASRTSVRWNGSSLSDRASLAAVYWTYSDSRQAGCKYEVTAALLRAAGHCEDASRAVSLRVRGNLSYLERRGAVRKGLEVKIVHW